jgi:hypothetical protein
MYSLTEQRIGCFIGTATQITVMSGRISTAQDVRAIYSGVEKREYAHKGI